jgi:hypothetical protein
MRINIKRDDPSVMEDDSWKYNPETDTWGMRDRSEEDDWIEMPYEEEQPMPTETEVVE